MIRKIIKIDEEKCNGCGLCAAACHEGAIDIIDGKAKLVREHFCDGLGDCLPACPAGAITFEEREAPEYDEEAVQKAKKKGRTAHGSGVARAPRGTSATRTAHGSGVARAPRGTSATRTAHGNGVARAPRGTSATRTAHGNGCPGSRMVQFRYNDEEAPVSASRPVSRLGQWPCQIKLVPAQAPFFEGAKLLIAADCTAYAYANMHEEFMKGKITIIGCPKLDDGDYTDKLTAIIRDNDIKSVTIVRMEVPCCGGLQRAAENALKASGKFIPWQIVTISRDGNIL